MRGMSTKDRPIMSTKTYNAALDFMPADTADAAATRPSLFARVKEYVSAMHNGLEAWREYERLTAAGIAPDEAARRSFQQHFEG
jgi:hypothetical protein